MRITKKSNLTGDTHTQEIPVDPGEYFAWKSAMRADRTTAPLIQNAFPELTDGQREFLLTGATEEEWDRIMGDDEDDDLDEEEPAF